MEKKVIIRENVEGKYCSKIIIEIQCRGWSPTFATGLSVIIGHRSKNI